MVIEKKIKFSNKLLDYIYAAQCKRLISLVWYNDLTYTLNINSLSKAFLKLYYNIFSYNLKKYSFLKKLLFIDTTLAKINKTTHK